MPAITENVNKVSKAQWLRWSEHARRVFNSVYWQMSADVSLFLHPGAEVPEPRHWNTTAWNAAWTAAAAVNDEQ